MGSSSTKRLGCWPFEESQAEVEEPHTKEEPIDSGRKGENEMMRKTIFLKRIYGPTIPKAMKHTMCKSTQYHENCWRAKPRQNNALRERNMTSF